MKHRNDQKVVVSYPRPDLVPGKFARCLLDLWRYDALGARDRDGKKVGGRQRILNGGGLIEKSTAILTRARTDIVSHFLDMPTQPDWLWMVDTDMTFEPTIVDQLVAAAHPEDRPVIGGLCFQYMVDQPRKFWPTIYSWTGDRLGRATQYPDNTLIPVAATGAACLLVHRTVLEAMLEKYGPPRPWFAETPYQQASGVMDVMSEDLTFCLRAQACGFPIHVHTGIKLGHIKSFEADEETFIAECAGLAAAAKPVLPTFAVIASKNRPEMLANLRGQLEPQVTETFVFDNGYDVPPEGAISAHDWPLHRMWNEGLERAQKAAEGLSFNVLVINDDVEVAPNLIAELERGLRSSEDGWAAFPDDEGRPTGWCFMLRGEVGLRIDERFEFWYGDTDLFRQVSSLGKKCVVTEAQAHHLDPLRSTLENPERLAQAERDEKRYAEKWHVDPETLWLAKNRARL